MQTLLGSGSAVPAQTASRRTSHPRPDRRARRHGSNDEAGRLLPESRQGQGQGQDPHQERPKRGRAPPAPNPAPKFRGVPSAPDPSPPAPQPPGHHLSEGQQGGAEPPAPLPPSLPQAAAAPLAPHLPSGRTGSARPRRAPRYEAGGQGPRPAPPRS